MELFLIRHGQSANNALADSSLRDKDPELTGLGRRQAEQVARFLAAGGHLRPEERAEDRRYLDRLYCSPMIRAMQTAEPIGLALDLAPEVWVDLHENGGIYLDHGPERGTRGYPGQTRSEMLERFPGFVIPEQVGEEGWWRDGDMEPFHRSQGRAIGVAARLREWGSGGERIGLVSHGGHLSCLLQALGGQLPADGWYYDHRNTAVTRLNFSPEGWITVAYLNRVDHLPEELKT